MQTIILSFNGRTKPTPTKNVAHFVSVADKAQTAAHRSAFTSDIPQYKMYTIER